MTIYLWIVLILIFILVFITAIIIIKIEHNQRRKKDILNLFATACKQKGIVGYRLEYVKKDTHDVYFEDDKNIFYVKIIYNPSNHEICINNAIKWQIRRIADNEERLIFASGVEPLMRLDLNNKEKREHKLFIIYPNCRGLLKVINECEMVFVYPDTDVYGAQVITYRELNSNPDLLKL